MLKQIRAFGYGLLMRTKWASDGYWSVTGRDGKTHHLPFSALLTTAPWHPPILGLFLGPFSLELCFGTDEVLEQAADEEEGHDAEGSA